MCSRLLKQALAVVGMRQVERSAAHKLARGMYEHQSLGLINSCPETVAIHLPTGDDELLDTLMDDDVVLVEGSIDRSALDRYGKPSYRIAKMSPPLQPGI